MRTILTGGTIVNLDGGESRMQPLVIEDEKIASVGEVETQPSDTVIDVSGKYLLPGFINSHAHLGWDGIHDLQDRDLIGGIGDDKPAVEPALGMDQARLAQALHHLGQIPRRNLCCRSDLRRRPWRPVVVRQKHNRP